SVDDKDSGSAQKDRSKGMEKWARLVKNVPDRVRFGIAVADDHYEGFGPATANAFRKVLGLKDNLTF
ncbi:MAG TPA: hypothetical protein VHK86_07850, partial [Nitrososphaera sp.]|nr:hypothetical protein [Nitrososphaera sp.]